MRVLVVAVVLLTVGAAPAGAAGRRLQVVWSGSGHAVIAQYRDSTLPDDASGWDVYSKQVRWKLRVPITVSGGALVKTGTPSGTVSGSGSQVGRSPGVTSCSGAATLPESNGRSYVPIRLRELGATRHKIKVQLVGNPVAWAFVPACGTSIGNATSILSDQTGPTFFDDQANPTFSILTADNFRASPSSFGARWDRPPLMYQRKIDYAVSSTVKVEPR